MNNVLVVFNYDAGRKKAVMYKKRLHKFLFENGVKFKFITIDDFMSDSFDEYDTVIAVGGDGTVNKAAKKIVFTDRTLAIIPSGTANLLAAKLGIPANLGQALKIIKNGQTRKIDALKINGEQCVLRCGLGYDSDIICKTPQSLKNRFGYFAYFVAGILFALRLKQKNYEITTGGKTFTVDATCIIIGNASNMYKNIVTLADNSEPDDGLFDVFVLKAKNPITFFYEFLRIVLGLRKNNPRAEYFKASSLKIKNDWTACHIDGEKTKLKGDIEVELIPHAIRVIAR